MLSYLAAGLSFHTVCLTGEQFNQRIQIVYLCMSRFAKTFGLLVILPHGPQGTGDADGGIAAGKGAEHHRQSKSPYGTDVINLGKDIDHREAQKNCQICVDGAHHGLIDA